MEMKQQQKEGDTMQCACFIDGVVHLNFIYRKPSIGNVITMKIWARMADCLELIITVHDMLKFASNLNSKENMVCGMSRVERNIPRPLP